MVILVKGISQKEYIIGLCCMSLFTALVEMCLLLLINPCDQPSDMHHSHTETPPFKVGTPLAHAQTNNLIIAALTRRKNTLIVSKRKEGGQ